MPVEREQHSNRSGPEIALLGGSFNPPHVAHLMAAYWVLATEPVSEVWLLPSYRHPFGKTLAPFDARVRMCELAARDLDSARVKVCLAERELAADPLVGKTARTLEHLVQQHPGTRFALAIGSDILADTEKWYRWPRVTELARIIVIGRGGHEDDVPGLPALPAISSTEVRERIRRREDVSSLVPRSVLAFIESHALYRGQ